VLSRISSKHLSLHECMFDNTHHNQEGSVLLYSLLLLVVMSGIAFVISSLVVRETQLARTFDDSLTSFYAAESGVERGLDIFGEHRDASGELDSTIAVIEAFAPPTTPIPLAANDAQYEIDPIETTNQALELNIPLLDSDGGAQIEMYDPDNPLTTFLNIESVQIAWDEPPSCTSTRQELTFYKFDSNQFTLTDDAVYKQVYTCSPSTGYDCQIVSNYPSPNTNYVLRIKPLDCVSLNANITFYNFDNGAPGGGSLVPVPSRAAISAIGTGNQSQRRMTARTKWVPNASGLVDFVLFSVEAVTK